MNGVWRGRWRGLRQDWLVQSWLAQSLLALCALCLCACGAVYPELTTGIRNPEPGAALDPPPPEDIYYVYFEGAVIPGQTRDGRSWSGGAPSTYARLKVGDTVLYQTPVEATNRKPTWPKQQPRNFKIHRNSTLTLELWVSDAIADKPLCQVSLSDIEHLRDGGQSEFDCDSGARLTLGVEPAHAVVGLGFYYELRGTDGVRVTRVIPRSPASRAGLLVGARIQTIQGRSVVPMDALEVRSAMNKHARGGVELTVEFEDGSRRSITLAEGPIYPLEEDGIPLPKSP